MKKNVLVALMIAAMAAIPMGCGKEEAQTEEPAQVEESGDAAAEESFDSLADWYTAKQIDFSQLEESLNETVTDYVATVAVEGDTLIYRFTAEEQIDVSDASAMEAEAAKMEAYCDENAELFMEITRQIAEESGVETTMSHVEVMDADLENLIYLRNF